MSAAGAVIADLEDAVLDERMGEARRCLEEHLSARRPTGRTIVRMNAVGTPHADADVALVRALGGIDAVLVPKATTDALGALPPDLPPLVALVETAAGVLEATAIARPPGVVALMIGTIDLAAELGIDVAETSRALDHARSMLVLASAAAGLIQPIDGVWTEIADTAGLRAEAVRSRGLGLGAKACVHPSQVATVEEVFRPTSDQRAWARRVVAAADEARARGRGAIAVDGAMVDRPVVDRARRLLASEEGSNP